MITDESSHSAVTVTDIADGAVRLVRLDQPTTRNALDTPMLLALADALDAAQSEESVRSVVLAGGDAAFASGADLRELASTRPAALLHGSKDDAWKRVFGFDKPLIAAVGGVALGGGCELAFSADLVVAADDATFGQPEIRLGILPGAGGTQRWSRAVGRFRAAEVALTGQTVSAWEAHRMGLVCEVVPRERLVTAASEWATDVARFAPHATRAGKAAIRAAESMPITDAMRYEKSLLSVLLSTDDMAEGVSAFLDRRTPRFEGR